MQEADPDHWHQWSEVRGVEGGVSQNEEGWSKCAMLNEPSWSTEKAFPEESKAKQAVLLASSTADQEWNAYARQDCQIPTAGDEHT